MADIENTSEEQNEFEVAMLINSQIPWKNSKGEEIPFRANNLLREEACSVFEVQKIDNDHQT